MWLSVAVIFFVIDGYNGQSSIKNSKYQFLYPYGVTPDDGL
jgi:hypothetical protein